MTTSVEINTNHTVRDIALGVTVIVLGAAILAFANIPTRTSVLENRVDTLEKNMDGKLDTILSRMPR
jgi:hypothetical protein